MSLELSKTGLGMFIRCLDQLLWSNVFPHDSRKIAKNAVFTQIYLKHQGVSLLIPPLQTDFRVLKGGYLYENLTLSLKGGVFSEKFLSQVSIFETQYIIFWGWGISEKK